MSVWNGSGCPLAAIAAGTEDSVVPGWPVDVSLPADPSWKSDYAATARRLDRDGVNGTLANLFVDTAPPVAHPGGAQFRFFIEQDGSFGISVAFVDC